MLARTVSSELLFRVCGKSLSLRRSIAGSLQNCNNWQDKFFITFSMPEKRKDKCENDKSTGNRNG